MGYFSLDIKKAKGTSDTTQSDHIERKIIPKNADPTRTHLNRVLVEYPDGVHGRDEAIAHRLNTAGIRRKITHDQVRVVRVVLSGTHEDMMNIQEKGKLEPAASVNFHRFCPHLLDIGSGSGFVLQNVNLGLLRVHHDRDKTAVA